jgi:hypothetical protein
MILERKIKIIAKTAGITQNPQQKRGTPAKGTLLCNRPERPTRKADKHSQEKICRKPLWMFHLEVEDEIPWQVPIARKQ